MIHLSYKLLISILRLVTSMLVDILICCMRMFIHIVSKISKLTNWLIAWRNRNIEALILRDKLKQANTYSEWVKIAKTMDKLKGSRM